MTIKIIKVHASILLLQLGIVIVVYGLPLKFILHLIQLIVILIYVRHSLLLRLLQSGSGGDLRIELVHHVHFCGIYIHCHTHLVQVIVLLVQLGTEEILPKAIRLLKIESPSFKTLIKTAQSVVLQVGRDEIPSGLEGFLFRFWIRLTIDHCLEKVVVVSNFLIAHLYPVIDVQHLVQFVSIVGPKTISVTNIISKLNNIVCIYILRIYWLLMMLWLVDCVQRLACITELNGWVLIRLILLRLHALKIVVHIITVVLVKFHAIHIFSVILLRRSYLIL